MLLAGGKGWGEMSFRGIPFEATEEGCRPVGPRDLLAS